jgi:type VI secretion system secreted protein Hcp
MTIYMKYGDVTGKVTQPDHKGWIELKNFRWGLSRSITTTVGSPVDRVQKSPSIGEIIVIKDADASSQSLMREALSKSAKQATIHFAVVADDDADVYLALDLTNTMISSYSHGSSGEYPIETLTLNFTKFEYNFTQTDQGGNLNGPARCIYDLTTGKMG